jgi:membrane-associated protease RseP (regulator of RpoE activity)
VQDQTTTLKQQRQAGRALTVVLAVVAVASISALAYSVIGGMVSDENSAATSAEREVADAVEEAKRSAGSTSSLAPGAGAGPNTTAEDSDGPSDAGASPRRSTPSDSSTESPLLAELRRRNEIDQANRESWVRSGNVAPGAGARAQGAGFGPAGRGASNEPARMPGADVPEKTGPPGTPFTPGYVEVLGVTGNTPASRAGLKRGDRILSYNGEPVSGREELFGKWDQPGLPDLVPIEVENRHGTEILYAPSGPLKAALSPAYN